MRKRVLEWKEHQEKNFEFFRKLAPGAKDEGTAQAVSPIMPTSNANNFKSWKSGQASLRLFLSEQK